MAALLTEIELGAKDNADCLPAFPKYLDLQLQVTDPEVVFELTKRSLGEERAQFALTALRIGVLSLRAAAGQVDAASVKEAGDKLITNIRDLLSDRARELTNSIATSLTQYFDPSTGFMTQKLESLMKKDGDLERVLNRHLGLDDSVLARTLAHHLGEQSPVFKLLSPTEAQGIRAQIEAALAEALADQRQQVLQEFSLDRKESALSRLVQEMQEIQRQLKTDFSGQADRVRNEFSLDKPDSAPVSVIPQPTAELDPEALAEGIEVNVADHRQPQRRLAALGAVGLQREQQVQPEPGRGSSRSRRWPRSATRSATG